MAFCDFVVRFNPSTDSPLNLTKRILYSVIIKRLKAKKPTVCFIGGDSGEGKSLSSLTLMKILLECQGLNIKDYVNDINVYTPIEYPKKIDALLNINKSKENERLKKVNVICVHEAREVVKAKNWYSFINTAISDVNAMSRSIKRLAIFIVSQFIRDISTDIRYTLNYYMIVRRPKGKKARLYINVLWKDDRDLEKPKLRKRKLSGYLVYPNGKYRRFVPQYLELSQPDKELVEIFENQDREAKVSIIRRKIDKLIKEMTIDMDLKNTKLNSMVDYYSTNTENLSLIGKQYKNKWRIKPDIRKMHDLTKKEAQDFEIQLNKKLKEKGIIEDGS